MAANPYRGLTEAQLLPIRDKALQDSTKGTVIVNGSAGGKSFGRQVTMSAEDRLRFAMEELRRLNPTRYGEIITRTTPSFV